MGRLALAWPAGAGDKLIALDQLARLDCDLAEKGIEALPPAVFEFDIAFKAAGL
jgi:hypothetical protein